MDVHAQAAEKAERATRGKGGGSTDELGLAWLVSQLRWERTLEQLRCAAVESHHTGLEVAPVSADTDVDAHVEPASQSVLPAVV